MTRIILALLVGMVLAIGVGRSTPVLSSTQASTYFVASSQAPPAVQAQADYVADGTCDDEQVKSVVASLPVGWGGTVRLGGGPFFWCSPINIVEIQIARGWWPLLGKVTIEGEARESTPIIPSAPMTSVFQAIAPPGYTVRNVTIRDLQITDNTPFVTVALIDIAGKPGGYSGWNTIDNVFLSLRAPATGDVSAVLLQAQMASSVTNTMVSLFGGDGGNVYGLRQYGGSFTTLNVDNVSIEGDSSGHTYGVQLAGWKHSLRHVIVEGHAVGIELTSVNGGVSHSSDITGGYFEGNAVDIRLRGKQNSYQHTSTVIRDNFFGSDLVGIDLSYAQDSSIRDNNFAGAYTGGQIVEGDGVSRISKSGNVGLPAVADIYPSTWKPIPVRYVIPGWWFESNEVVTVTPGRLYFYPIFVSETITYDRLGLRVVTGSPGRVRAGLYSWSNGKPGVLMLDAGTLDVTYAALVENMMYLKLTRGYYFEAYVSDAPFTIQGISRTWGAAGPVTTVQGSLNGYAVDVAYADGQVGAVANGLPNPAPALDYGAIMRAHYIGLLMREQP